MEKFVGTQVHQHLDVVLEALEEHWSQYIPMLDPEVRNFEGSDDAHSEFLGIVQIWGPFEDPVHVPELKRDIQKCIKSTRRKKQRKRAGPTKYLATRHKVPLEIIYMIVEYLEIADAWKMHIAFGEQLPLEYWKKQIPDIFFEVDGILPDRIDWPYLAVMLDSKYNWTTPIEEDVCDWLRYRKYIIDVLRPVKRRVFERQRSNY